MSDIENNVKIIISGLDYAGKTSVLTALEQKYDFQKTVMELKPTIRIEYHSTTFLGNLCYFWDMGGQEKYRDVYQKKRDVYFADTDLLLYILDIQDVKRYKESLDYLDSILEYFVSTNQDVPVIIAFHKFDPDIRDNNDIIANINDMRDLILDK